MQSDPSCCPLSCLWPSASTTRGARLYPAEEELRVFVRAVAPSTERSSQSMSNGAVAECHRHLSCLLTRQSVHSTRTQHFPVLCDAAQEARPECAAFLSELVSKRACCLGYYCVWRVFDPVKQEGERVMASDEAKSEELRSQSKINAETLTKTRETQAT